MKILWAGHVILFFLTSLSYLPFSRLSFTDITTCSFSFNIALIVCVCCSCVLCTPHFAALWTVCFLFLFHVLRSIIASSLRLLRLLSPLSKFQSDISPCQGSGVSRRPVITGTRLRSQGSQCGVGISCGYDSTMIGFSPNTSIFPWQY